MRMRHRGSKDTTSADGIYYQLWTNGKATVNAGPNGLQHFGTHVAVYNTITTKSVELPPDDVVAAAKANGIRLIIPL